MWFSLICPLSPGTVITADAVTFTLNGYETGKTVTDITVGISTPNITLNGSGYGNGSDKAYMIFKGSVDVGTGVTGPTAVFENHTDYYLEIEYIPEEGYSLPDSFWDGGNLIKEKFKLAGIEDAVVTYVSRYTVRFKLPQLGTTTVDQLAITLNGYEPDKKAGDVTLTVSDSIVLPNVDSYDPYARLYCFYDDENYYYGDTDGDFLPISASTVLKTGDQYPFTIKFYPADGYDFSELKKEDITLSTPYGNCTATRFRLASSGDCYWLTFDLPVIGAVAKNPITSVTLSDLTKPVVGEMPDNSITVSGTGVSVDEDGSYWGRFDSPSFSPHYSHDTAVDSVVFRDGETYMFQLYLNTADGYEFTADSKFYFAGEPLPAPDMDDLSKSFAMVNPEDSTAALIYINMNDIAHVHVSGDWNSNDTHHWHKCTASGCDAGTDVSKLPNYAEHSFVSGLCECGAHQHSWAAAWSANATHHWRECSADGCKVTENSGKDGYAVHDFTAGACVCGVSNVITSIEISGITAPVVGATPINSASVDKVGAEVDEEYTFWVRYDTSTGRTRDTYADGTSVSSTPFRDGEIYLLQITIKPKTGYSFTADTKILYGGAELGAPDAANPTASCADVAPDGSIVASINPAGAPAAKTLTGISITTPPTKTTYTAGETFDPTGYTVSPAGALSESNTEITITYTETGVAKTATQAITVTAAPVTYTVTVISGSATPSGAQAAGTAITITADAAPESKRFKEWIGADDLTFTTGDKTTATATFTMPAEAVNVTATYEDIPVTTYTITFDANGGSVTPASTETTAEGKLATLPTPTRSDSYSFKGWYTAASGGREVTTSTVFDTDATIYAQWTYIGSSGSGGGGVSTYAITVKDAKNGEITSSHKSASAGTTVTLKVDADKGYTLETLTVTDGRGKEVKVTEKSGKYTFKMPASKVTVKATFMDDNTMLNNFVDVPADAYYYDAVLWAAENGITGGIDAVHFAPNATCTRAQAVTFLWRAAGSPEPRSSVMPFEDVATDAYYYKAVLWAVENGITSGTTATAFAPTATCTRAQIVTFLWRSANR